jgi:hypothetical protein
MPRRTLFLCLFWLAAIITVIVMATLGPAGWDFNVYWRAAQDVSQGADPYSLGIAAQRAFHAAPDPHVHAPMTYVYPPMTLPLLRLAGLLNHGVAESFFFILLIGGFALQLWAGWQMAGSNERRWLCWLLPAVAFFPGLMNDDVLLSGNVVYLLYGLVLAAAVPGWKRDRWSLYYTAVLFASCFKAPLLSLLAFPIVAGKRQWRAASLAGAAGLLLFALQSLLWPTLFHEYLTAVQLQFDFNHDCGMAPSGLLGSALLDAGRSYSFATGALYLVFGAVVFCVLLWTGRSIQKDSVLRDRWLPIAFIGTVLLNPRIKEYDVAALTVPMVLAGSRLVLFVVRQPRRWLSGRQSYAMDSAQPQRGAISRESLLAILLAGGWFLAANAGADGDTWKPIELSLLLVTFFAGTWLTLHRAHRRSGAREFLRFAPWTRLRRHLPGTSQEVLP